VVVRNLQRRLREPVRDARAPVLLQWWMQRGHLDGRFVRARRLDLCGWLGRPGAVSLRPAVLRRRASRWRLPVNGRWDPERARQAHAERTAARSLETLYRQADTAWSGFRCPGTAECCQLSKRGREPWLWGVEWDALRRAAPVLPAPRSDGGCRFLDADGRRCTVYRVRPLGCRTYFCHRATGPGREPGEEMDGLQRRLEALARSVRPDERGPEPLTAWLEEAER